MPLGFPAITDPRQDDWRGLQGAVRNIRERITQVEAFLTTVQSQANQTTSGLTTIGALTRTLAQLAARVAALEALIGGSTRITLVAGAAIALDDPVVMASPTTCVPVDIGDPERIYAVVGVATQAATQGTPVVVQIRGAYALSYGAFTAGNALYCGLTGLTESPSYGNVAIPVGVATGAQSIWIQPAFPRLTSPGVYDEFEQFLPVTWGLFQNLVPEPLAPTSTVSFAAVDGTLDGFFMRADAAPALATTLVTPDADSFSLSTASDPGGTTDRGNITLITGDNDTYIGVQLAIDGATTTGNGSLLVTTGDWEFRLAQDAAIEALGSGDIYLTSGAGITVTAPSGVAFFGGSFQVLTAGSGFDIAEGADARMGLDTLSGGTVTVNTAAVATNSRIFITAQNSGSIAAPAAIEVSSRVDATSFTITSSDAGDDRDVAWLIIGPG